MILNGIKKIRLVKVITLLEVVTHVIIMITFALILPQNFLISSADSQIERENDTRPLSHLIIVKCAGRSFR